MEKNCKFFKQRVLLHKVVCVGVLCICSLRLPVAGLAQTQTPIRKNSENVSGVPQTKENNKNSLQGKWILEKVSAFEENVEFIPFSLDSLKCCEIPIEIDVQQEKISIVGKNSEKYAASVRGDYICFPICAEWKIVDGKLQLQWGQDIESQEARMLIIVLTYKSK